jgi:hypothetical protein
VSAPARIRTHTGRTHRCAPTRRRVGVSSRTPGAHTGAPLPDDGLACRPVHRAHTGAPLPGDGLACRPVHQAHTQVRPYQATGWRVVPYTGRAHRAPLPDDGLACRPVYRARAQVRPYQTTGWRVVPYTGRAHRAPLPDDGLACRPAHRASTQVRPYQTMGWRVVPYTGRAHRAPLPDDGLACRPVHRARTPCAPTRRRVGVSSRTPGAHTVRPYQATGWRVVPYIGRAHRAPLPGDGLACRPVHRAHTGAPLPGDGLACRPAHRAHTQVRPYQTMGWRVGPYTGRTHRSAPTRRRVGVSSRTPGAHTVRPYQTTGWRVVPHTGRAHHPDGCSETSRAPLLVRQCYNDLRSFGLATNRTN